MEICIPIGDGSFRTVVLDGTGKPIYCVIQSDFFDVFCYISEQPEFDLAFDPAVNNLLSLGNEKSIRVPGVPRVGPAREARRQPPLSNRGVQQFKFEGVSACAD